MFLDPDCRYLENKSIINNKYVRLRGRLSIHTCRSYVHTPHNHVFRSQRLIVVNVVVVVVERWLIGPILGFWWSKVQKMGDSLPWTSVNRRAKFDPASFILGGEIRNRTNTQTNKQTVNDRHVWIIHTQKQLL